MVIVRDGLPPVGDLGLRHSTTITPLRGWGCGGRMLGTTVSGFALHRSLGNHAPLALPSLQLFKPYQTISNHIKPYQTISNFINLTNFTNFTNYILYV